MCGAIATSETLPGGLGVRYIIMLTGNLNINLGDLQTDVTRLPRLLLKRPEAKAIRGFHALSARDRDARFPAGCETG